MDTDYFLDTIQWIFVIMEFACMLLFSFVMYGYFKNSASKLLITQKDDDDDPV